MDAGEVVASYVDAIRNLQGLSDLIKTPDACTNMLGEEVRIPIQLPVISSTSSAVLRKRSGEIANTVREYARGIGVSEVAVPYLDECVPIFKSVSIDSLDIDVQEKVFPGYYSLVAVVVDPKNEPVRRIPLAWHGMPKSVEYVDSLSVVYLTALLISRNPWFVEALKTAVEKALSEYRKTLSEVADFLSALRILGAETIG